MNTPPKRPKKWMQIEIPKGFYDSGQLLVLLNESGCLGTQENDHSFLAYFPERAAPMSSPVLQTFFKNAGIDDSRVRTTLIEDQAWHLNWQADFKPLQITPNIVVYPHWHTYTGREPHQIAIKPGMAFGTGTHPTTQLAIILMEKHLPLQGKILDAGCGSGILTIAALKLGAGYVEAWDIDPSIEQNFSENMELNGIQKGYKIHIGDVAQLKRYDFDLIVSNIERKANLRLLNAVVKSASAAKIIFTGILREESKTFTHELLYYGRVIESKIEQTDWVAYLIR